MIIHDPIYGCFEVPGYLDTLIMSPEVRRLAEVRLLNAPTPSLATLSEIRRLSHTLGVLHLALSNPLMGLSTDELRAFLATILIHDAATPPFAHLFEYYLKDHLGWDHETAISGMLTGHSMPGNTAFQIRPGEEIVYETLCIKAGIDFDIVLAIANKSHRASNLLFGKLDFDNLDNVLRMCWALGIQPPLAATLSIARNIQVTLDGKITLPQACAPEVAEWAKSRKAAYQVLVFDELAVAAQAALTKAIRLQYAHDQPTALEWAQTDGDLIELLRSSPYTKEFMLRNFAALPRLVACCRIEGTLGSFGFTSRDDAIDWVERAVASITRLPNPIGYVFVDKGAFSKQLSFIDPQSGSEWGSGETSESIVFYCFVRPSDRGTEKFRREIQARLEAALLEVRSQNAHETPPIRRQAN